MRRSRIVTTIPMEFEMFFTADIVDKLSENITVFFLFEHFIALNIANASAVNMDEKFGSRPLEKTEPFSSTTANDVWLSVLEASVKRRFKPRDLYLSAMLRNKVL